MKISIAPLQIPFKMAFSHASASRAISDNILVLIQDNRNIRGMGECCPRPYVSGETADTVKKFLVSQVMAEFWKLRQLPEIVEFEYNNRKNIDQNTAAFCAAESALLDYLARLQHLSMEEFILKEDPTKLPQNNNALELMNPTMVIGLGSLNRLNTKLIKYLLMGFVHFKIKITADSDLLIKLQLLLSSPLAGFVRKIGGSFRLDGNNCFDKAEKVLKETQRFHNLIVGLEEPLVKNNSTETILLLKNSEIPLILDDSFVLTEDLQAALSISKNLIPNIRLSKNGGLLRSRKLVRFCQQENIPYILGSQVGETSLLTRLGLCLVNVCSDYPPLHYEGAFSKHLLLMDPVEPNLVLGFGAKIKNLRKIKNNAGLALDFSAMDELTHYIKFESLTEVSDGT